MDTEQVIQKLQAEKVNLDDITDDTVLQQIDGKDIRDDTIKLSNLTPTVLQKLDQEGIITLTPDIKDFIHTLIAKGINYFKPFDNALFGPDNRISQLDPDVLAEIPNGVDLDAIVTELEHVQVDTDELDRLQPDIYDDI